MESTSQILTEISKRATEIQEKYPELQKYFDETRSTLTSNDNESMQQDLKEYLIGLKEMVNKYKDRH